MYEDAAMESDLFYEDDWDGYDDRWYDEAEYADEFYDDEPDLDFAFEFDSAMASAGWGTDEDYGYFGGEDY